MQFFSLFALLAAPVVVAFTSVANVRSTTSSSLMMSRYWFIDSYWSYCAKRFHYLFFRSHFGATLSLPVVTSELEWSVCRNTTIWIVLLHENAYFPTVKTYSLTENDIIRVNSGCLETYQTSLELKWDRKLRVSSMLTITLPPAFSMGRRPLMGGNWKLNPRKVSDAVGLATEVRTFSMFCLM